MTKRYDILQTRKYTSGGEEKTAYTRIGVMFPLDKGGFTITFEALPIPSMYKGEIQVQAVAFEPKPKGDTGGSGGRGDMDDEIPF